MLHVVDEQLSLIFSSYNFCSCLCNSSEAILIFMHVCLKYNIYMGNVAAQLRVDDDNDTIDATAKIVPREIF